MRRRQRSPSGRALAGGRRQVYKRGLSDPRVIGKGSLSVLESSPWSVVSGQLGQLGSRVPTLVCGRLLIGQRTVLEAAATGTFGSVCSNAVRSTHELLPN